MKKKSFVLTLIILSAIILVACNKNVKEVFENDEKVRYPFVGKSVEPFEIKSVDDKIINNNFFEKSKLTAVVFWSPSCEPCLEELKVINELNRKIHGDNFQTLAISVEGNKKEVIRFKKEQKLQFDVIALGKEPLMKSAMDEFEFIPTVIFVNQKGEYTNGILVGSRKEEAFKEILRKLINTPEPDKTQ